MQQLWHPCYIFEPIWVALEVLWYSLIDSGLHTVNLLKNQQPWGTREIPQYTSYNMQRVEMKQSLDRSKNGKISDTQWQFSVEYLPLRRPLGNSPTVWESVRSKPTPFALIILGLWPDWWKKTLLIIKCLGDHNKLSPTVTSALPCKAKDETLPDDKTTTPRVHPITFFVQHSYQEDDCHDNSRPILPNMHLTPCTTASHTKTDITAVHARRAVCVSTESTLRNHVMLRRAEHRKLTGEAHTVAPFTLTHWSQHFYDKSKNLNVPQSQSKIINYSGITNHSDNNVKAVCWPWQQMSKPSQDTAETTDREDEHSW